MPQKKKVVKKKVAKKKAVKKAVKKGRISGDPLVILQN